MENTKFAIELELADWVLIWVLVNAQCENKSGMAVRSERIRDHIDRLLSLHHVEPETVEQILTDLADESNSHDFPDHIEP